MILQDNKGNYVYNSITTIPKNTNITEYSLGTATEQNPQFIEIELTLGQGQYAKLDYVDIRVYKESVPGSGNFDLEDDGIMAGPPSIYGNRVVIDGIETTAYATLNSSGGPSINYAQSPVTFNNSYVVQLYSLSNYAQMIDVSFSHKLSII